MKHYLKKSFHFNKIDNGLRMNRNVSSSMVSCNFGFVVSF